MAGKVLNIKVCSPLKLRSGLTGNYHAICHYSYNLPLPFADTTESTDRILIMEPYKSDFKIWNAISKNVKKKQWQCLYSDCEQNSINSHFLQRNGILDQIAVNGHIYELGKNDIFQMEKKGEFGFFRVGINKGFSLPLFCKKHDSELFRPIEVEDYSFDEYKTQLLFSLRSCCNEIRRKEQIYEINKRVLNSASFQNGYIKQIIDQQNNGLILGLQDLNFFRSCFEKDLADIQNSKSFTFKVFNLPKIDLCVSGTFTPLDYSDKSKDYMAQKEPLDSVFVNLIPTKTDSILILGYQNDFVNPWILDYIVKWDTKDKSIINKRLTELLGARINSWCLSPTLYERISPDKINRFVNFWNTNSMNLDINQDIMFDMFENINGN
jgi:hypothetical protein